MKGFLLISYSMIFLYCLIIFFLVFGDKGLISYTRLVKKKEQLEIQIREQELGKRLLFHRLQALKDEGDYYEYEIKNKLYYLADNEVIIFFPPTNTPSDEK